MAHHWAAQRVDALTLAETLLLMVRSAHAMPDSHCAAFYETTAATRLEERIDFLLTQPELSTNQSWLWLCLLPITLPLLTALLHR